MKTLSERLRAAMNAADMTQAALAEASGVAQPTIYKILAGKTQHSAFVVQMADALSVSPSWLAMGKGSMEFDADRSSVNEKKLDNYKDFKIISVWAGDEKTNDLIPIPYDLYDESCKAFIISHDTGFPAIKKGAIILVSSKIRPENNDYIYVKINESYNLFTYVSGSGSGFASSADPRVPLLNITPDLNIIGVVTYLSIKAR